MVLEFLDDPDSRELTALRAQEAAYARGVEQALALAYRIVVDGGTAEDIGLLADEAGDMRDRRDYHPAFLDELQRRVRAKRCGNPPKEPK